METENLKLDCGLYFSETKVKGFCNYCDDCQNDNCPAKGIVGYNKGE
jgi:predicted metal-binding protein